MKLLVLLTLSLGVICPSMVMAEAPARLNVSATIPPQACEYPERCDTGTSKTVPAAATRVVATLQKINYVGSPPTVEKQNDLLVVKF